MNTNAAGEGPLERPVRPLSIAERAVPLAGWTRVVDAYPAIGESVEIIHFGGSEGMEIMDTATVDEWGICPHAADGGHGKRSTVTHWRCIAA